MTKLSLPSIDSGTTECTVLNCDGAWETVSAKSISYARSPNDLINDSVQAAFAKMRGTLSAMACIGCGGNIDPQTLLCSCCGRQYRLVAKDD